MAEARERLGMGILMIHAHSPSAHKHLMSVCLVPSRLTVWKIQLNNPSISRYYRLVALAPALVRYLII